MPSAMPCFPYQRQQDDRGMVHQKANPKQAPAAGRLRDEVRNMIFPLLPPMRRPGVRARIFGFLCSWLLRLQHATWRVDVEGLDRLDQMLAEGRRVLLALWHGKYVPLIALFQGRRILTFTSRSPRGDIIGEICRRFGYEYVQIPDQRGYESLRIMQDALAAFQAGAVAVDGPLGPYRVVKRGAIQLASTLEFTVVPISVASRRKRILTYRWDHMELPRLFTRVFLVVGDAIDVPAGLPKDEKGGWARRLRDALEDVDRHAESKAQANR